MSRRRIDNERGAVAILVAICMMVILVAVGMVLDFGIVRLDRQGNKAAADVSSAAGIRAIEGVDGKAKPWRGVCQALRYLRVNDQDIELDDLSGSWKTGAGAAVAGDPCATGNSLQDASCTPGTPSTWAWFTGSAAGGRIAVDIKSGYRLSDGGFPEESILTGDDGESVHDGCDQLAVIIQETRSPGFGSLATDSELVTRTRSVARATIGEEGDAVVALLLLEQNDCLVIDIQGASGASVRVRGHGDRPGMIHSDSLGNGGLCTSTDKIIDGDSGPPARIWAEDAESGTPLAPGIIGIVALSGASGAVATNAHDASPATVLAEGQPGGAPIGRDLITRRYVDLRYRQPVANTVADATAAWSMDAATANSAGYTVLGCTPASTPATKVYVNCPTGITYSNSFSFSGPDATVIYNGPVKVAGAGGGLTFNDPRKVYIKGSSSAGLEVAGSGQVRVNTGAHSTCAARFVEKPTARTRLVIGSGPMVASGSGALTMCQTAVVMADNNGGSCPVPSSDGVAPYDNACNGYISVGGSGGLDWSAPNAVSAGATTADYAELEDLALWTETAGSTTGINKVEGGGTLKMSGVFFLPNAKPFRIAGGGGQDIGENAQFVTRRLEVGGNGHLDMQPNPEDVVPIPYFGDFFLVR